MDIKTNSDFNFTPVILWASSIIVTPSLTASTQKDGAFVDEEVESCLSESRRVIVTTPLSIAHITGSPRGLPFHIVKIFELLLKCIGIGSGTGSVALGIPLLELGLG
jgi:hypothetical protein